MTDVARLLGVDQYAASLGIELVSADPVIARMAILARHLNFRRVGHGGAIFSLADCAFSLASNAEGPAVAIDTHLAITAPTNEGDVLTAQATELKRGRRLATYRVDVTNQGNRLVAAFTGTVYLTDS